jgi:hypothetical protein
MYSDIAFLGELQSPHKVNCGGHNNNDNKIWATKLPKFPTTLMGVGEILGGSRCWFFGRGNQHKVLKVGFVFPCQLWWQQQQQQQNFGNQASKVSHKNQWV